MPKSCAGVYWAAGQINCASVLRMSEPRRHDFSGNFINFEPILKFIKKIIPAVVFKGDEDYFEKWIPVELSIAGDAQRTCKYASTERVIFGNV